MTKKEAKIEYNKISDKLDEMGYDLGGWRGVEKDGRGVIKRKEPSFLLGRQFELLRIINN